MRYAVEIEDINTMRRQEGIEDASLRKEIRALAIGDLVNLTFLMGPQARGETLFWRHRHVVGLGLECGALLSVARHEVHALLVPVDLAQLGHCALLAPCRQFANGIWKPARSALASSSVFADV